MTSVFFNTKSWKDKATGYWMLYSKKFCISAYGKTKKEAREMFVVQVGEILKKSIPK